MKCEISLFHISASTAVWSRTHKTHANNCITPPNYLQLKTGTLAFCVYTHTLPKISFLSYSRVLFYKKNNLIKRNAKDMLLIHLLSKLYMRKTKIVLMFYLTIFVLVGMRKSNLNIFLKWQVFLKINKKTFPRAIVINTFCSSIYFPFTLKFPQHCHWLLK